MIEYRDASGRSLADYPRPSVAVDTAVLTIDDHGHLAVVLIEIDDTPRLPGTFLREGERLAEAVLRSLREKAGIEGLTPTQLEVFDDPDRDDRGWVLSVAHLDVVPLARLNGSARARLCPVGSLPALPWGHELIIAEAVTAVRSEYAATPDPRSLVTAPFTLRELRAAHEAVAGAALPPDTFRRQMEPQLTPTDSWREGTVGKPARLFDREAAR